MWIVPLCAVLVACGDGASQSRAGAGGSTAAEGGSVGSGGTGATGGTGTGGTGGQGCVTDLEREPGRVITSLGAVRGALDGDTYAFRGIPYAAPPVGDRRFRPPEPPGCWEGERMATDFGPQCPQKALFSDAVEGSEDCLTLNVWMPLTPPASPRAVMVFIHGGGNLIGTSGAPGEMDPMANGRPYVEGSEIVFVSINYRLGALGFMAHPALSAESPRGASGNYGLLDQIAALQWVRDNIAAFGGDPARVMVFGESAGAIDTCALFASPLAAGLFHRALMQSGACIAKPLDTQESDGGALADSLSCSDADCLRALSPAEFIGAQSPNESSVLLGLENLQFSLTIDGWALPDAPVALVEAGVHNDVPFVVGSNAHEMHPSIPLFVTLTEYQQQVYDYFGQPAGDQILAMYDPALYGGERNALSALSTDVNFTCPARRIARAAAGAQSSAVHRYFFTHVLHGLLQSGLGAFHALELFFVFKKDGIPTYGFDEAELDLSEEMFGYWSRFAITGDPNDPAATPWPIYATSGDAHIVFDTPTSTGNGIRTAECDLIDAVSPF
jgi:para-nitrobenzyl esterase